MSRYNSHTREVSPVTGYFFLCLWICLSVTTCDVLEPQIYSVQEAGSLNFVEHVCDSYEKQFSSVEKVKFENLRQKGERCLCSLQVSTMNNLDAEAVVSIKYWFDNPTEVKYSWFKECEGNTLNFNVTSFSQQIELQLFCGNYVYSNDINNFAPIDLTKLSVFTGNISMRCKSENVLTTSAQPSTATSTDTSLNTSPVVIPQEGPQSDDENGTGSGSSAGKTAGIVIGVLLIIGCIVGAVVGVILWRRYKKRPVDSKPEPPGMTYDVPGSTPEGHVPADNAYDNSMYKNNENNNAKRTSSASSLEPAGVNYANIDPASLKKLDRPVRAPSTEEVAPNVNYVDLDWGKQSTF